jgi:hypothetical protein
MIPNGNASACEAVNTETEPVREHSPVHEKTMDGSFEEVEHNKKPEHSERVPTPTGNLVYDQNDEEPEIQARTFFALAAMFLLNFIQVVSLQGPPAVVRHN